MDCGTKVPGTQIQGKLLKGLVPQCDPCVTKAEEMKANLQQQLKRPTKKSGKKKRSSKPWEEEESDESTQKDAWAGVIKVNCP
jgi:ribosome-binding protein aMBF1 (putative translation factor)